ncbi:MAG: MarC family protein [Rhodospirillales bacterium]
MDIFFDAIVLTIGASPIMNPFSTAPLFVSLTADFDEKKRTHQALMGCIYAFFILVVFLLLGAAIIKFFGISCSGHPGGRRADHRHGRLPHAVP